MKSLIVFILYANSTMSNKSPFSIYNASAGSGKTFTLVKEYLKILLSATTNYKFKDVLAITFTNKAVGEMKERILEMLTLFSKEDILNKPNSMFSAIVKELSFEPEALQKKSKEILNTIIHNYAAFDISTIDGFNHKLIRTFAYDLKLPINFEVELDTETLLNEAVDRLIAKAGKNKRLTKVLVDFAIEKADDDKSWDVARDFNSIAKLLIKESDIAILKTLEDKTLEDFKALKIDLISEIENTENLIKTTSEAILKYIIKNNLDFGDFTRSTLPNHFIKASKLDLKDLYKNKLETNLIERKSIYNKTLDSNKINTIDAILPDIEKAFYKVKQAVFHYKFLKAFYKNLTPLSVLTAINKELIAIKTEENKMLINEFNSIISNEIKNQPTPFIYERMGEKFRHYFIDEFQDTSQMQWDNLIPLVDNTLSGENIKAEKGTTMLVGDAKQAIYRWRGGKAEQFIDLYNKTSRPFQIIQDVENLEYNYRSFEAIVNFNNSFFKHISFKAFNKEEYQELYTKAFQKPFKTDKGFVNLNFIDFKINDDKDEIYNRHILKTIESCCNNGYKLKDICILVRKKKHGITIANFLNNQGIKISSSETTLINNSPEVRFINNLLTLLVNPNDNESKIRVLVFLAEKYNIKDKHHFFKKNIHLKPELFFKSFESFQVFIDPKILVQEALFEIAETIVRSFKLIEKSNAYIQFYLDTILEYSQKNISDVRAFLEYFKSKKEKLSIVSPQEHDALKIMTIHKSKGLEFPVVIFPYSNINIYEDIEPKEWFKIDPKQYQGFEHTLLNYNKDFEFYGETGNKIYIKHQAELELDSINLLYVALTRPVEQLYIIGKKEVNSKGILNLKTYSGLLIDYLIQIGEWEESKMSYSFGSQKRQTDIVDDQKMKAIELTEFISTSKLDHNIKIIASSGYLWDTNQEQALEKGNLLHDIMEHIKTENDVDFAINDFIMTGIINNKQAKALRVSILQIINHPDLKKYFSGNNTIYNERDIISKTGKTYRPDRLIINDKNEVAIIDYKTGLHNPKYQHQLQDYQDVLEEMKFKVSQKILIYVNKEITIKNYN